MHSRRFVFSGAALAALLLMPGLSRVAPAAGEAETDRPGWMLEMLQLPADNVRAALDDPSRPAGDRERDAKEKTEAVLRASGIARDMRVGDVRAGDGHFVQVVMAAVRRSGRTYANNDPASLSPEEAAAWKKRLDDPSTADIARVDSPLADPMPAWVRPLDLAFNRHAAHDAVARGIDPVAMHASVFAALRPGSRYVVIDSRSAAGADAKAAASLCRAGEDAVRRDVEAAGFVFLSRSEALGDAADDPSASACDGPPRDRFLMVFGKPAAQAPQGPVPGAP